MKLVIFGATGRTGIPLIKQALENGHEITAFVRNPDKLPDDLTNRVTIVEGDILNIEDVDKAVQNQDAVASVIGQSKKSPEDLQTRATEYIVS
ncbi:MAG: NAD(P)H-binding protein, partial [Candidatus Marinimicrobia bacterium]|nr:NAD(P)H-binding protein [Candidatus Neomarinimicrobiota bacterium]